MGEAAALLFAREGARVTVADVDVAAGQRTAKAICDGGGNAIFISANVAHSGDVEALIAETVRAFGRLDILYNNAGIAAASNKPVADITEAEWTGVMDVNLKGVFLGCKYAIPEMIRSGGGAIINTASCSGLLAYPGMAPYCTSKSGVIMLTKTIAVDYAEKGIRANCICPGAIDTPLTQAWFDSSSDSGQLKSVFGKMHPLGRMGQPAEVAATALFLASDESSYVTGIALSVDGGRTSWERPPGIC